MLATIGFISTGIAFAIFAYTFDSLVVRKTKLRLDSFSYAYYALSLALLTWGVAAAVNTPQTLKQAVLIGDALLLVGSLFMLDIWLGKARRQWLWLAAMAFAGLLYVRASFFEPTPYIDKGILIFNTQTAVAVIIAAIFAGIWLPVSMKVAKQVTHKLKQDSIAQAYSYIYIAATLSALVFVVARRLLTVVLSFVAIGICFVMLISSNLLVGKLMQETHHRGKRK